VLTAPVSVAEACVVGTCAEEPPVLHAGNAKTAQTAMPWNNRFLNKIPP
jgi:hypothetical protein